MKKEIKQFWLFFLIFALLLPILIPGQVEAAKKEDNSTAFSVKGYQKVLTFPDWAGYVDDTLAMNHMYTFTAYEDQGKLYLNKKPEVTEVRLFVNNHEVSLGQLKAGSDTEIDISNYTVNGKNTLEVSGIQPAYIKEAVTVKIPYPTVIQGSLKEVGIRQTSLDLIDTIITNDIKNGFTSAQLAIVKNGKLVYQNAWGRTVSYNPDGSRNTSSKEVTNDTLYDLASNTKMYSINYVMQYLVTQGKVNLDEKMVDIFGPDFVDKTIDIKYKGYNHVDLATQKAWKSQLTIRDILRHQAGFPPDPQYHNNQFNQETQLPENGRENPLFSGNDGSEATKKKTLEAIFKTPLRYEPGTKTQYSDVDYMLLDFVVEKKTGKRIDLLCKELFWEPMGLSHISYRPLDHGFSKEDCAATELNGNTRDGHVQFDGVRTQTIQGEVHDEKAYYAMNGISGHAGLFANATDLAKLASLMLTGGYGENSYFAPNIVDVFKAPKKEDAANWALGWWRQADQGRAWYFGTQSSRDTIGHQGWTGTLTCIDPDEQLVIVYLTNKINSPLADPNLSFNSFRGNWYTSATLGFVPQILYQGFSHRASQDSAWIMPLLYSMVEDKFKIANEAKYSDQHPVLDGAYAITDTLFDVAEKMGSKEAKSYAEKAINLLSADRDAKKISELRARLNKKDPAISDGWHLIHEAKRYYLHGKPVTGVRRINRTLYCFNDKTGDVEMGWHRLLDKEGKKHDLYFDPNFGGGCVTGMRKCGTQTTYLLASNGDKLSGWHRVRTNAPGNDGQYHPYYFDPKQGCGMVTGKRVINGHTHFFRTGNGWDAGIQDDEALKLIKPSPAVSSIAKGSTEFGTIYSPSMKLDWNYEVYLPAGFDARGINTNVNVIYLLNGAWGAYQNYPQLTHVQEDLDRLSSEGKLRPTVAVFVDGFNSYYVDGPAFKMESAIIQDLIPSIEKKYNIRISREKRAIGGLSMGGHGASRLALKYPGLFSYAVVQSPAIWYNIDKDTVTGDFHVFVDANEELSNKKWQLYHPVQFMNTYKNQGEAVHFFVTTGEKDTVVPVAEVDHFVSDLKKVATDVIYLKDPDGIHGWKTWDKATTQALNHWAEIQK